MRWAVVVVVLAGCGRVGFDAVGDARVDGRIDPVPLGPFGPWQTPIRQTALNTNSEEFGPTLSVDGLEVIFGTRFTGDTDLWRATRLSRGAVFGAPDLIPPLMTMEEDSEPTLSLDGTTLVFQRRSPPVLWTATRTGTTWSTAIPLGSNVLVGHGGADFGPGDLSLVVNSKTGLFEAFRDDLQANWTTLTSLDITFPNGGFGTMRSDGLELYWEQNETGSKPRIYRATRTSRDAPFGPQERIDFGGLVDTAGCGDPELSDDGELMVFVSDAPGGQGLYDIYSTQRAPI